MSRAPRAINGSLERLERPVLGTSALHVALAQVMASGPEPTSQEEKARVARELEGRQSLNNYFAAKSLQP